MLWSPLTLLPSGTIMWQFIGFWRLRPGSLPRKAGKIAQDLKLSNMSIPATQRSCHGEEHIRYCVEFHPWQRNLHIMLRLLAISLGFLKRLSLKYFNTWWEIRSHFVIYASLANTSRKLLNLIVWYENNWTNDRIPSEISQNASDNFD